MISPQRTAFSKQVSKKHNLTYPVLTDERNEVAAKFRLAFELPDDLRELYSKFGIDLERYNGDDSWTLPMPARYIIGRDGVVKDAHISPDYTKRPEPEEIIEILDKLA